MTKQDDIEYIRSSLDAMSQALIELARAVRSRGSHEPIGRRVNVLGINGDIMHHGWLVYTDASNAIVEIDDGRLIRHEVLRIVMSGAPARTDK